ncbi:MAG: alpha/beta hydrolase [Archangium sp.]|nr:alpha/beta hydrolase [Archangium sp.]MDP3153039.1 alpha/beta hydrolase [Archangium sp.]MDP3572573.1 alpha/beta hydrolase [Archangium sp.]
MPFRLPPPLVFKPDELYRVPTADGTAIALGRYHPRGPRRFVEPVILGHSLGTNRFNLDFDERYSFARALARRGFETWVLELRGGLAGSSEGATFDLEAEHDVAAALGAITSTGPTGVTWVGHSRGGLLAYAHLARNPQAPIRAIVTLGSPLTYDVQPGVQRFVAALGPTFRLPSLPLGLAGWAAWPLGLPPDPIGKYLVRADNMDAVVIRQAIAHVAANIPGGVGRQFARWVRTNAFDGEDGFDFRKGMKVITAPVLAIAGARDFLAPPEATHLVENLVSGPVELLRVGLREGFSTDYGHGDLVLGVRAPDEVLPRVADFLARHSTPTESERN